MVWVWLLGDRCSSWLGAQRLSEVGGEVGGLVCLVVCIGASYREREAKIDSYAALELALAPLEPYTDHALARAPAS